MYKPYVVHPEYILPRRTDRLTGIGSSWRTLTSSWTVARQVNLQQAGDILTGQSQTYSVKRSQIISFGLLNNCRRPLICQTLNNIVWSKSSICKNQMYTLSGCTDRDYKNRFCDQCTSPLFFIRFRCELIQILYTGQTRGYCRGSK